MRINGRPATRERVTQLALRALEEAQALAERGPVPRTTGHRLALAWLVFAEVASDEEAFRFWCAMIEDHSWAPSAEYAQAQRQQNLSALLDRWHRKLGWEPPSWVWRGELGRKLTRRRPL